MTRISLEFKMLRCLRWALYAAIAVVFICQICVVVMQYTKIVQPVPEERQATLENTQIASDNADQDSGCTKNENCSAGFLCHFGLCKKTFGQSCSLNGDCIGKVCNQTCKRNNGQYCGAIGDCSDGLYCVNNICKGQLFSTCSRSSDCGHGLTCNTTLLQCKISQGSHCNQSDDCDGSNVCNIGSSICNEPCPDDGVQYGTKCYYVNETGQNFGDAVTNCRSKGLVLLFINTTAENTFVANEINREGFALVGDVYPFTFSFEDPAPHVGFSTKTRQYCAVVERLNAKWHRHGCELERAIAVCVLQEEVSDS